MLRKFVLISKNVLQAHFTKFSQYLYMCSEILLNSIVEQINKFIRAYYTQEKRFKSFYKQDIEFPGKIRLV